MASLDVRWWQMGILICLVAYGLLAMRFDVSPLQVLVTLGTVLLSQAAFSRWAGLPRCDYKSAFISGLSLCLLLRSNSLLIVALAGWVAIGSKFLLRVNGKHLFNPTNLGISFAVVATGKAWVSPGQWGSGVLLAAGLAFGGLAVVQRARRSDVTLAFLLAYPALFFARAFWLGDPLTIPLHQLANGAFLIFSFLMISDPKTTPDSRLGRVVFALLIAVLAYQLRFRHYYPNALIVSLTMASLTVPVIDWLLPGSKFDWTGAGSPLHNVIEKLECQGLP